MSCKPGRLGLVAVLLSLQPARSGLETLPVHVERSSCVIARRHRILTVRPLGEEPAEQR